jgi:hypothetical protein
MPHIRTMSRRACFIRLALILALGSSAVLAGIRGQPNMLEVFDLGAD